MKKIYLIDGNSFIYRMFFALPEFSTKDGTIVNALFGMAKFFVGQLTKENPDYLVFIKDARGENFRHKIYADYKATRERMPDNLRSQISLIEEMISKMGFEIIEIPGFEADDVIGTLVTSLGIDKNNDVYILSGDKDLYSLCQNNVKIYDTMKAKIYDYELAKTKFDVNPEHIIDYLAIVGDSSDNIPGISGFGPKKAVDLINKYGTVEEIFNHINDEDFILSGKTLEKLKESREIAFLSKRLATIDKNVELNNFYLENFKFNKENILNEDVKELFKKYEFNSLYSEKKNLQTWNDLNLKVQIIKNNDYLEKLKEILKNYKKIFFDTETTSLNIIEAELVGISIYLDDENIFYINHMHNGEKVKTEDLKNFINYLFSLDIEIIGHNLKYDLEIIENFLSGNYSTEASKNSQDKKEDFHGQMTLGL
ncbi:MAG: 5'-3' exonuclease H3TH domain-containing protein [Candidatus Gracilibacteria bacterium]|nr:5'-3' exonuclease H3TH domain-containing protein [Candidatus Gracilibacteria bacterium]